MPTRTAAAPIRDRSPNATPGSDTSGELDRLLRDARTELHARTTLLRALLDLGPLAVITFDRDGRVLTWSRKATDLLQWTPEEVIGRRCPVVAREPHEELGDILRRVLRDGHRVAEVEMLRRRKDGRSVEVSVSIGPLRDETGTIIGAILVLADLTEQGELRRRMLDLAYERLSPREREVTELLGRGRAYKEIARELGCSKGSVSTLAHRAYAKLLVGSRHELVTALLRRRFVGA